MKRKSSKNQRMRNRIGMLSIAFVVLVLLGILLYEGKSLQHQITSYDVQAEALTEKIEAEKKRTEEIEEQKAYMQTDAYAEEVARDKLGLVKENEIVFTEEE